MSKWNRKLLVPGVALFAATFGLAACDLDDLMTVEDPETVNEHTINNPDMLDIVVAGAMGNFTTAYSGNGDDAFLSVTAVMTDEFYSSGTFPTRTATDRRDQLTPADGNTSDAAYVRLQRARRALGAAAEKVEEFEGTSNPDYAHLKALEAYTYVALGEAFCGAVPISYIDEDGEFVYGSPQTAKELFSEAVSIFDIAIGAGSGDLKNLAAVGKARALLNSGNPQGAMEAVQSVPTDFTYFITHSVAGASNPIYSLQSNGRYSVSDREGGNGVPFRSADDPRAPWWQDPDQEVGFDDDYELFKSLRYTSFESPVLLASGVEARLIEAEALVHSGGDWLGVLNGLRADVQNLMELLVPHYSDIIEDAELDPLTDPGSFDARIDMVFYERAMWLYLTGHRLGDLRRLVREYDRPSNTVYPSGNYHKGGTYGNEVVFPLDFDEGNNTNFEWDSCVLSSAN